MDGLFLKTRSSLGSTNCCNHIWGMSCGWVVCVGGVGHLLYLNNFVMHFFKNKLQLINQRHVSCLSFVVVVVLAPCILDAPNTPRLSHGGVHIEKCFQRCAVDILLTVRVTFCLSSSQRLKCVRTRPVVFLFQSLVAPFSLSLWPPLVNWQPLGPTC